MDTRNLKKIMALLGALALALALRLAYIQALGHEDLSAAMRAQSMISLEGSNTRGIIYDRNGAALVADEKRYVYIIKDGRFDSRAAELLQNAGAEEVSGENKGYRVYSSRHYDKDIGRRLMEEHGAYILQAASRYGEDQMAAHLIGYVNKKDSSGAAGLELMYDERLSQLNRRLYAVADVKGNILPGRGLVTASEDEEDSYVKDGIRTTIDKELQEAVEEIMGKTGNACAAVVLDAGTGGVAAMACTPDFDPNEMERHLASTGDELLNKATQGEYPPGSLFKLIVAAAGLERGVSREKTFPCKGEVRCGALTIGCSTGGEEGHGEIGLEDAMAQSCNSYFIQLGQQTGADAVMELAARFGLGEKLLDGYPQEADGHLMTEAERMGDAIGNLCIGQGETLVTPLQMAAVTNIIANDGIDRGVHLLMEETSEEEQVISQNTAAALQKCMESVMTRGTAQSLGLTGPDGMPEAAAKTGTAEYDTGEREGIYAWISGYAPCREPEYTITVLVEDGTSGTATAGPIFAEIVRYLEGSGSYSRPTLAVKPYSSASSCSAN